MALMDTTPPTSYCPRGFWPLALHLAIAPQLSSLSRTCASVVCFCSHNTKTVKYLTQQLKVVLVAKAIKYM